MTAQELEAMLQQGHTLKTVFAGRFVITAYFTTRSGYVIHETLRSLYYKTSRGVIRKMLTYAPAEKWEVVS